VTPLERTLIEIIRDYAYNSMEVCRIVNGFDWQDRSPCYTHGFGYVTRPHRCAYKERGCRYWSFKIYNKLRALERRGRIRSVKLRWFDGRRGRGLRLDEFRIFFIRRECLAKRLIDDIRAHLA